MPNKNYLKGVRKERKLVNGARALGLIAFRSAGSHSPIDVVIIDKKSKQIRLVQCKPDDIREKEKEKLIKEQSDLTDMYSVSFRVI